LHPLTAENHPHYGKGLTFVINRTWTRPTISRNSKREKDTISLNKKDLKQVSFNFQGEEIVSPSPQLIFQVKIPELHHAWIRMDAYSLVKANTVPAGR
jgi:hypothetical protein